MGNRQFHNRREAVIFSLIGKTDITKHDQYTFVFFEADEEPSTNFLFLGAGGSKPFCPSFASLLGRGSRSLLSRFLLSLYHSRHDQFLPRESQIYNHPYPFFEPQVRTLGKYRRNKHYLESSSFPIIFTKSCILWMHPTMHRLATSHEPFLR